MLKQITRYSGAEGNGTISDVLHPELLPMVASVVGVEEDLFIKPSEANRGFASLGWLVYRKNSEREPVGFLRFPMPLEGEEVDEEFWQGRYRDIVLARDPSMLGLFAITSQDVLHLKNPNIANLVPEDTKQLVQLLAPLPAGRDMLRVVSEIEGEGAARLYEQAGRLLASLHGSEIVSDGEASYWRQIAALHPIQGSERFDTIVRMFVDFNQGWVDEAGIANIREKMITLARHQVETQAFIARSHGDYWEANLRVTESGEVVPFDPALGYALPSYDVGFALGGQLADWLLTGNESNLRNISAFLFGYESEGGYVKDALAEIEIPLAYKFVVRAARGELLGDSLDSRRTLIRLTKTMLENKIAHGDVIFSFDRLVKDEIGG